ncbi:hypothetical protein LSTR_LSTR014602 [Laodelphax striatellus]|uniref:Fzo/mitofusin HR2 domain-containing protein n=1 Tax=Laodelphax striatellus TaxID=195883 RepID=A0A482XBS3_LAOST|nr:hypothetical protein LSTR_LSTR014602 [Laodelphax striatellus]
MLPGDSLGFRNTLISADPRNNSSPLQTFVKAKRKINDIFGEIDDYVHDAVQYITATEGNDDLIQKSEAALVEEYVGKVTGIREVLKRDHMKVAFFGSCFAINSSDRMAKLLPPDNKQVQMNVLPRREPFEILYRLNCDNLCADFHEDLQFRFSWSITSIIQRFAAKKPNHISVNNYPQHPQRIPPSLVSPVEPDENMSYGNTNNTFYFPQLQSEEWSLISRFALASTGSQGTMGGLLVAGFMLKTVGWRFVLITGAVYGCLYAYERLTWTTKAKERAFKNQYVNHATKKLKLIVDLTSANCSHQVQQ